MGEGWSFSYSDRIEPEVDGTNTVTWFTDTGMRLVFTRSADGFTNPAGIFGSLTGSARTGFTWKDFDGNTTMFGVAVDGFCPISLTKDRFGNGVAITYVGNTNRIDKVSDLRNAARWIGFTYNNDARPHIASIRDSDLDRSHLDVWLPRRASADENGPGSQELTASPVVRYAYFPDACAAGLL